MGIISGVFHCFIVVSIDELAQERPWFIIVGTASQEPDRS